MKKNLFFFMLFIALLIFVKGQQREITDSTLFIYRAVGGETLCRTPDFLCKNDKIRELKKNEIAVIYGVQREEYQPFQKYFLAYVEGDSGLLAPITYMGILEKEYLNSEAGDMLVRRKIAKKAIDSIVNNKILKQEKGSDPCYWVSRKQDKFTDEITLYTRYNSKVDYISKVNYFHPSFHKIITGSKIAYYLSIETHGSIPVVDGRKVYIIFDDGSKWVKDVPIDVDVASSGTGYVYSAWIALNQSDIDIFKNKRITDFRLDIFEDFLMDEQGQQLKEEFNCLLKMK